MKTKVLEMPLFLALLVATTAMDPPRNVKAVLTRDGKFHNLRFLSGDGKEIDGQSFLAALKRAVPSEMCSVSVKPTKANLTITARPITSPRVPKRARTMNMASIQSLKTALLSVTPAKKAEDIAKATAALGIAQRLKAAADTALAAAVAREGEAAEANTAADAAATAADEASAAGAAAAAAATAAAAAELELNPVADAAEVYFDAQEVDLVAAAAAANGAAAATAATLATAQANVVTCTSSVHTAEASLGLALVNLQDAENE